MREIREIFTLTIEREGNKIKTVILGISLTAVPVRLFEYQGKAINLSIAESSKTLAIARDNEGTFIFGEKIIYFERTSGLPIKLLGCEKFFICLDSEGTVSWHDKKNGKILAAFSLNSLRWKMTRKTEDTEISG